MRVPDLGSLLPEIILPKPAITGVEQLLQLSHSPREPFAAMRNFIAGSFLPHIEVPKPAKKFESTSSPEWSVTKHTPVENNEHPPAEGKLKLNSHLPLLQDALLLSPAFDTSKRGFF